MAAVPHAAGESLAHAAAVPDFRIGSELPAGKNDHGRVRALAREAAAAAVAVRHGSGGAAAGVPAGGVERLIRGQLCGIPGRVLHLPALAGRRLRWLACRRHLEPSLVPALPAGLQPGSCGGPAAAALKGRAVARATLSLAARRVAGAAAVSTADVERVVHGLPEHARPPHGLGEPRALFHRVPVRLLAGYGQGHVGKTAGHALGIAADGHRELFGAPAADQDTLERTWLA